MCPRIKQFSENLWLTRYPWKYGEYAFFPQNVAPYNALKWKMGAPCITSQQDCQDVAYAEKLLGI